MHRSRILLTGGAACSIVPTPPTWWWGSLPRSPGAHSSTLYLPRAETIISEENKIKGPDPSAYGRTVPFYFYLFYTLHPRLDKPPWWSLLLIRLGKEKQHSLFRVVLIVPLPLIRFTRKEKEDRSPSLHLHLRREERWIQNVKCRCHSHLNKWK